MSWKRSIRKVTDDISCVIYSSKDTDIEIDHIRQSYAHEPFYVVRNREIIARAWTLNEAKEKAEKLTEEG